MSSLIKTIFPIVFLLGTGILFKKKNVMSEPQIDGLKFVAMNLFLPVVLFRTFLTTNYSWNILNYLWIMFPICLAMLGIGYIITHKFNDEKISMFMMTGFEMGMLGYPLYSFLFGNESLGYMALIDFGHSIFMFSTYFVLLNIQSGQGGIKWSVISTIKSPFFIAFVSGLLLGVVGVGKLLASTIIMDCLNGIYSIFSQALSATILISLGYGIKIDKRIVGNSIRFVMVRLIIVVFFGTIAIYLSTLFFGTNRSLIISLLITFILPPTYTVSAYVKDSNQLSLVSTFSSIYTLITIALYILICCFAL